jgi:hypothetical protein
MKGLALNTLLAVGALWSWWRDGADWITLVAAMAIVLAMTLVADRGHRPGRHRPATARVLFHISADPLITQPARRTE